MAYTEINNHFISMKEDSNQFAVSSSYLTNIYFLRNNFICTLTVFVLQDAVNHNISDLVTCKKTIIKYLITRQSFPPDETSIIILQKQGSVKQGVIKDPFQIYWATSFLVKLSFPASFRWTRFQVNHCNVKSVFETTYQLMQSFKQSLLSINKIKAIGIRLTLL